MSELLVEIGLEEIPAPVLPKLREQLFAQFSDRLHDAHLKCSEIIVLGTLRRLVIAVTGLDEKQEDREELVLGPPRTAALDAAGNPTKAASGFAKSRGVSVEACSVIKTEKGEYFGFTKKIEGSAASAILPALCTEALAALTFPKAMRWGAGAESFVRPVRWILALLDGAALPFTFCGITSSDRTRIDRFKTAADVRVSGWKAYREIMSAAGIELESEARRSRVAGKLAGEAAACGGQLRPDDELLGIVAELVERPLVVSGEFAPEFLELPPEILTTSMREHQKHFSVSDDAGRLMPRFITVAEAPGSRAEDAIPQIRHGNERVLRARLEDARFFWQDDARLKMRERSGKLDHVLFQQGLGSYLDKCARLVRLVDALAPRIPDVDSAATRQAAELCKADLTSDMVKEFTSLQGIVGGLYARREGASDRVWRAIYDQYLPISVEDALPATAEGCLLSLADRADTIAGCFGLGLIPTGSRDPMGLRRLAQGLVRIAAERGWRLDLIETLATALDGYASGFRRGRDEIISDLREFIDGRLRFLFEPYGYDMVNAVIGGGRMDPADMSSRLDALRQAVGSEDFRSVAVAFKRIKNIIKEQSRAAVEEGLLREREERDLHAAFRQVSAAAAGMIERREYEAALMQIATLRPPVDRFFDKVLVMDPDLRARSNRIGLLQEMSALFLRIADFSEIDVEKHAR